MKKSLVALAALATLACAGSAMAQSSVVLYGRMDMSVGALNTGTGSKTQMFSGNLTTSRYGFRGTEDLGGGLKANFKLETAIDGTSGGSAGFSRASWVGLSGGFGSVALGLNDSVYKDIYDLGVSRNLFDSEFTPVKAAYGGVGNYNSRPAGQIRYDSPKFGGFSAAVTHAPDAAGATNTDITALNVRYADGPLDMGVAIQTQDNTTAANNRDYAVLAAAYNFGVFRVSGQYQNAKNAAGLKDRDFALGVSVPVGAFDLSVGLATSKSKLNGATFDKGSAFSMGATYALSKRTLLYAAYLDGDIKNSAGTKLSQRKLYSTGMRHDF